MSDAVNQTTNTKIEPVQVIESWGLDYHLGCAVALIARVKRAERTYTRDELQQARAHLDRAWEQMQQLEQRQEARRKGDDAGPGYGPQGTFEKVAAAFEKLATADREPNRYGPYASSATAEVVRRHREKTCPGEKYVTITEGTCFFVERVPRPTTLAWAEVPTSAEPTSPQTPPTERPVNNVYGPYRTLEIAESVARTLGCVRDADFKAVKIGPNCFVREYLKEATAKS